MRIGQGVLVVTFYTLVVVSAILFLTAVQMRSSAGAPFDTWRLNYAANRLFADNEQSRLVALKRERSVMVDAANGAAACLQYFDDKGAVIRPPDSQTAAAVQKAKGAHMDYNKMPWDDVKCLVRGQLMLTFDKQYYDQRDKELTEEIKERSTALASIDNEYSDLVKEHREYLAFIQMENFWYLKALVRTPYDLLVMCLVMLMGALGGIVRNLRNYLDPNRPNPTLKDYFFVPTIGMVVAVGGYVLAKTGLLLLSSPKEETSLSPFMIGLVGIVSGLLAKEVVDRITAVGIPMLQGEGRAERQAEGAGGGSTHDPAQIRELHRLRSPRGAGRRSWQRRVVGSQTPSKQPRPLEQIGETTLLPEGITAFRQGFSASITFTALAAGRPKAAVRILLAALSSECCARLPRGPQRVNSRPSPPPHSVTLPSRPAKSWIYCQAVRPDLAPRVVAHSSASAVIFSRSSFKPKYSA